MDSILLKNLWRHRKECAQNPDRKVSGKIRHLKVDLQLKTEVFPRMRPDHISLSAKKDPLICAFASRYLKIHREKHFVLVTSRKMRELAKLILELKKIKPSFGGGLVDTHVVRRCGLPVANSMDLFCD
nr:unnamed protein product [Callosobruchus analis]